MASPDFWNDPDRANKLSRECKNLKDTVEACEGMEQSYDDIGVLIEMGNEENDTSMIDEVRSELDKLIDSMETLRLKTLLTGPYDANNAILSLNAGAGGLFGLFVRSYIDTRCTKVPLKTDRILL
jgi:peptide chain release factor 2